MRKFLTISFCLFFFISSIKSQISITNSSFTYSQDFNSLANTGTSITWTDNMTITGWYSDETTYNAGTGSSNTGALYSFGAASSSERALGEVTTNSLSSVFGVVFQNNTSSPISSLTISYDGEIWLNGTATGDKLDFQYQVGASTVNATGTWIDFNPLDFTSNDVVGTTAISGTISGLNLAVGQNIVFRWVSTNPNNADDGLGIDNFSFSNIILPVKFSGFNLYNGNKNNIISFTTASETNNDYFTIERSVDGITYEAIGEIKGAGNSSKELSYEFTDEKPLTGLNYYRIKQTDYDGKYSYSEVRSVRFTDGASVTVSPRTTEGRVDITTDMEDYNVEVYTAAGAQVKAFTGMNADQSISIEDLKAGIYFLRVSSTTASETVRVIKL